jgi:hypothetical protein
VLGVSGDDLSALPVCYREGCGLAGVILAGRDCGAPTGFDGWSVRRTGLTIIDRCGR